MCFLPYHDHLPLPMWIQNWMAINLSPVKTWIPWKICYLLNLSILWNLSTSSLSNQSIKSLINSQMLRSIAGSKVLKMILIDCLTRHHIVLWWRWQTEDCTGQGLFTVKFAKRIFFGWWMQEMVKDSWRKYWPTGSSNVHMADSCWKVTNMLQDHGLQEWH